MGLKFYKQPKAVTGIQTLEHLSRLSVSDRGKRARKQHFRKVRDETQEALKTLLNGKSVSLISNSPDAHIPDLLWSLKYSPEANVYLLIARHDGKIAIGTGQPAEPRGEGQSVSLQDLQFTIPRIKKGILHEYSGVLGIN